MRVVATKQGHDGLVVREPGEEFEMPEDAKGSWFKAVDTGSESKPGRRGKEPPKPDGGGENAKT